MMVAVEAMGARRIDLASGYQCNKHDAGVPLGAAAMEERQLGFGRRGGGGARAKEEDRGLEGRGRR
jgi:hypothetical protein